MPPGICCLRCREACYRVVSLGGAPEGVTPHVLGGAIDEANGRRFGGGEKNRCCESPRFQRSLKF